MKITVEKTYGYLVPMTQEDDEKISHIKHGDVAVIEIRKIRNPRFHRKYFKMLSNVFRGQEKYKNIEDLLTELKIRVGCYKEQIVNDKLVYVPKSISFAHMDDYAFSEFYSKSIDALLEMLPELYDKKDLDRMAMEIIQYD